jgi:hypothetical protein
MLSIPMPAQFHANIAQPLLLQIDEWIDRAAKLI